MAEIVEQEKQSGGKKKPKKHPAHIDMTPMVDLMCLLITFFMLTTAFSKSKVMELVLPEKNVDNKQAPVIAESRTINVILGPNDVVYWYPGKVDDPKNPPPLQQTDYSDQGIRKMLLERNRLLFKKIDAFKEEMIKNDPGMSRDTLNARIRSFKKQDDSGPIVLIKAHKESRYANIVDIIDEMSICGIANYAIVDMNYVEEDMVKKAIELNPPTPVTP